jgi:hypothetical protein
MKISIIILISLVVFTTTLSGVEWKENFSILGLGWDLPVYTIVGKKDDSLLFGRYINKTEYKELKHISDLRLNEDGFYTIPIFGNESVAIWGGNYFFFHDLVENRYSMYRLDMDYAGFNKMYTNFVEPEAGNDPDERFRSIKSIIVPDVLKETLGGIEIRYSTDDMMMYYARKLDAHVVCNPEAKPWASNKEPAGMSIVVEFGDVKSLTRGLLLGKSDHVVILNGYVNPLKRNLYKANRRIKTLLVESLDPNAVFSEKIKFDDDVKFRRIPFPEIVSKIKLTILDYYEGDKYKDICVQYIGTDFDLNYGTGFYTEYDTRARAWKK